jgi:hypothetical protein
VEDRVARAHGIKTVSRCPGEGLCERYTRGAGRPYTEERSLACLGCVDCEGRAPLAPAAQTRLDEEIVNVVERRRCERDSGAGLDLSQMTPLSFELLMHFDQQHEAQRRAHEARMHKLIESLAGLAKK